MDHAIPRLDADGRSGEAEAEEPAHDSRLDIRREVCPMTFVRARLALDRLPPGAVLLVELRGAEPRANVPRTAEEQGHAVLAVAEAADGSARVWIRRGG